MLAIFSLAMVSMGVLYQLNMLLRDLIPAEKYQKTGRVLEILIYAICVIAVIACIVGFGIMEINQSIDLMFPVETLNMT